MAERLRESLLERGDLLAPAAVLRFEVRGVRAQRCDRDPSVEFGSGLAGGECLLGSLLDLRSQVTM